MRSHTVCITRTFVLQVCVCHCCIRPAFCANMGRVRPGKIRRLGGTNTTPILSPSKVILVLAVLLPIGGHYVKHLVGPMKGFIMKDKKFNLTNTQFGAVLSSSEWMLFVGPLLSGVVVDKIGANLSAIVFCVLSLFGHVLFTISLTNHNLFECIIGRCLYGIGETAMSISQGSIICHTLGREGLTMALGWAESVRALANWLGKALPVQIAAMSSNYLASLWFGAFLLLLSLGLALVMFVTEKGTRPEILEKSMAEILSGGLNPRRLGDFPLQFWLLVAIHVLQDNVHNIFAGISTDYIQGRTGMSIQSAALVSSLDSVGPIFLSSLVSWMVSRYGNRLWLIAFSGMASILGFVVLLFFPSIPIVVCMLLLSLNNIISPTLLRSSIPMMLHPDMYGVGFGMYAGMTGLGGNANILIGHLRDVSGTYDSGLGVLLFFSVLTVVLSVYTWHVDRTRHGCLDLNREQLEKYDKTKLEKQAPIPDIVCEGTTKLTPTSNTDSEDIEKNLSFMSIASIQSSRSFSMHSLSQPFNRRTSSSCSPSTPCCRNANWRAVWKLI